MVKSQNLSAKMDVKNVVPIWYTPSELKAMEGYEYNGERSHLKDGKCSVYENRPFVCRIYSASERFKCEDCVPERFLSE